MRKVMIDIPHFSNIFFCTIPCLSVVRLKNFRKSLSENVEVFLIRRAIRNNTHFLCIYP